MGFLQGLVLLSCWLLEAHSLPGSQHSSPTMTRSSSQSAAQSSGFVVLERKSTMGAFVFDNQGGTVISADNFPVDTRAMYVCPKTRRLFLLSPPAIMSYTAELEEPKTILEISTSLVGITGNPCQKKLYVTDIIQIHELGYDGSGHRTIKPANAFGFFGIVFDETSSLLYAIAQREGQYALCVSRITVDGTEEMATLVDIGGPADKLRMISGYGIFWHHKGDPINMYNLKNETTVVHDEITSDDFTVGGENLYTVTYNKTNIQVFDLNGNPLEPLGTDGSLTESSKMIERF